MNRLLSALCLAICLTIFNVINASNTDAKSEYTDYEPSYNDVEGQVVYEGRGDYFIVETASGYTVLEVYSGLLSEGQYVYGQLNSYNFKYILNTSRDREVKVYIEDYMLSSNRVLEWLGRHNKLKYRDQEIYDKKK